MTPNPPTHFLFDVDRTLWLILWRENSAQLGMPPIGLGRPFAEILDPSPVTVAEPLVEVIVR